MRKIYIDLCRVTKYLDVRKRNMDLGCVITLSDVRKNMYLELVSKF